MEDLNKQYEKESLEPLQIQLKSIGPGILCESRFTKPSASYKSSRNMPWEQVDHFLLFGSTKKQKIL